MKSLSAPSKDLVLGLINQNNTPPKPITKDNLYFGRPKMDADGITSIVPTVAVLGSEYTGYANFSYRRINLSKVFDDRPVFRAVGASTLHRMLPDINRFLGLNFTTDDVQDTDVQMVLGGEEVNIYLNALPTSLGYTGSFIIRFLRQREMLSKVVADRHLLQLRHVHDPADAKVSMEMTMYNMDFSNDRDAIAVDSPNSYWLSLAKVQDLMRANGFNSWPAPAANSVKDVSTKSEPRANPNYDRVVIQKDVNMGDYFGDAFFHYNLS